MSEQEYSEIQDHNILARGMVIERDARGRPISIRVPNPFLIDQLLDHGVIGNNKTGIVIDVKSKRQ